jgi:FKBP-type peptidyl-prolyl cis-trans isomerase FkpA
MIKSTVQFIVFSLCLGSMLACAQTTGTSASTAPKLDTDEQKTLYALGLLLGRNIKPFALAQEELAIVNAGLKDAVLGATPQVELDTYGPKVNELAQKRAAIGAEEEKKKGQEFADKVQPAEFPLNGVVPCWTEALQKMKKGEKAQVVCPSSAAYGDRGQPPDIPPGATLSFEVELLDFGKP